MAMDSSYNLAIIRYYAREKYYHHVQHLVLECEQKFGSDPEFTFWRAYSLTMQNSISEAMRELESIQDKRDTVLCSTMLLVYAHKKCKSVDRDAVHTLEKKIKAERQTCGERALYLAATFLWLSGRHDKAREYVERALKMSTYDIEALILHGWIDLTCGRESVVKKSMKYFEEALSISKVQPQPLDGLLGKVQYYIARCHFSHALEVTNQAIASYPDCLPTLIVKMNVQLTLQDWEQAVETAQRCLHLNLNCIEATRVIALSLLSQDGNYSQASVKLGELLGYLDRFEPTNHQLYYDISLAFTRLCGRSLIVLQQTATLLERAIQSAPTNAVYVTELAHVLKLQGNSRESLQTYERAFQLDETSVPALTGIIYWQVIGDKLDEAEQQIEFLTEIQSSIGKNTDLLYVSALLAQKRKKETKGATTESSDNTVMSLLQEAIDVHFTIIKGQPFGIQYMKLLDPDLLVQIARIMLGYAPTEPIPPGSPVPISLKRSNYVLEPLIKFTPGLVDIQFLLAKITYLSGNSESAQGILQKCLDQHDGFCDGHLLMAEISLYMKAPKMAEASLEKALSHSFEVQSSPFYHLLKAQVEKQLGNHVDAFRTLTTALSVMKSKKPDTKPARPQGQVFYQQQLTISDEVSVYLELCEAYCQLSRLTEAKELMQEAAAKFQGTTQEMRISIANADLAIASGNTEQALAALKAVTPDHPHYIQARRKMADIFLKHQKNKEQYIQCYKELASQQPGTQSALLLGDAYISILEPDKAIEVYETALKKNPRDATLASKIGQALVRTHNYNKAVNYYESALKSLDQHGQLQYVLRLDLANLYLKIKNYAKAERTLQASLDHPEDNQLSVLIEDTKCLQLLAKVFQKSGSPQQAFKALSNARDMQSNVLKRVGVEQVESVQEQTSVASTIAFNMAEQALQEQNFDTAERFYREAILHNSDHYESHLALAKLYLFQENLKLAEHELVTVLQTFPNDDNATLMLAELKFRSNDYVNAISHYKYILNRKPNCYKALAQLIEMLRRAGQLDDSIPFLSVAEKNSTRASYDPGYSYCQGLYHWYRSDPTVALQKFNQSRKDSEWGERALLNMIEICLNPDNETVGGETFKAIEEEHSGTLAAEKQDSDMMALHTAERFIKEMRPKSTTVGLRLQVLSSYTLLASRKKTDAEQALQKFVEIASTEKDFVPALLGMATAHMIMKQTPKARNQLKRISKLQWNTSLADDFEKSWLLLSDIYIQAGKYDLASELLTKKCLHYNKSCYKAWEYLGYIAEKEQSFQDAANHYENAWKHCYQTSPNIGYKLSFNYLKAKKHIEAIDVCHVILGVNPNYPKIRKEILDKARLAIRA